MSQQPTANSQQIAISVKGVYKDFRLPHEKVSSIKNIFAHALGYIRKRRKYETQHALRDISFEVKKGEFFGIVGRNGSGKSTLLKIIAGIYQPTNGNIAVHGKLVPFIELGVGFNPELTGRENVFLNGALLGFSEKEIYEMYDSVVEFAELEQFMDQKLKNYSSGMQVRLAFSMAVRAKADILLIDEVLAVGDADFQKKCYEYFRSLKKYKKTVVFVSHDMNAIQQFCDKAILIEGGVIIKSGNSQLVAKEYSHLFLQDNTTDISQKNKRWGDGKILYKNPKVSFSEDRKIIQITSGVEVLEDVGTPKFGFSIKDGSGRVLFGTNTTIIHAEIKNISPGRRLQIKWAVPNILNSGEYTIDLTISYSGLVAEWWEDALKFTVNSSFDTPYIVNPTASFILVERDREK